MSEQVEMETLPECDLCTETAHYDTKTRIGPWAYTCNPCYNKYSIGKLGTGYGQKLITKEVK